MPSPFLIIFIMIGEPLLKIVQRVMTEGDILIDKPACRQGA
jgi:hypothetical protein